MGSLIINFDILIDGMVSARFSESGIKNELITFLENIDYHLNQNEEDTYDFIQLGVVDDVLKKYLQDLKANGHQVPSQIEVYTRAVSHIRELMDRIDYIMQEEGISIFEIRDMLEEETSISIAQEDLKDNEYDLSVSSDMIFPKLGRNSRYTEDGLFFTVFNDEKNHELGRDSEVESIIGQKRLLSEAEQEEEVISSSSSQASSSNPNKATRTNEGSNTGTKHVNAQGGNNLSGKQHSYSFGKQEQVLESTSEQKTKPSFRLPDKEENGVSILNIKPKISITSEIEFLKEEEQAQRKEAASKCAMKIHIKKVDMTNFQYLPQKSKEKTIEIQQDTSFDKFTGWLGKKIYELFEQTLSDAAITADKSGIVGYVSLNHDYGLHKYCSDVVGQVNFEFNSD